MKPQEIDANVPEWKRRLSIVLVILSGVYTACPIDLMPTIPIDNILAIGAAIFNAIQQNSRDQHRLLVKISKYMKWIFVLLLILAVLIFGTFIVLTASLIAK